MEYFWGGLLITCVRIVHPILVTHLARETSTALFCRHAFARSENPNGIPSPSPGLRGTSYPGSPSVKPPQPQRGWGQSVPDRGHDLGRNAVGVVSISGRAPKVGVGRQPWAGGRNPFGIVRGHILALRSGQGWIMEYFLGGLLITRVRIVHPILVTRLARETSTALFRRHAFWNL